MCPNIVVSYFVCLKEAAIWISQSGTPIYERNGQKVGELNRIVMDGKTGDVSHLVVGKGWLLPRDIVVSRDDVEVAEPDRIQLRLTEDELEQQPDFYEIHYVTPSADDPRAGPICIRSSAICTDRATAGRRLDHAIYYPCHRRTQKSTSTFLPAA